MCKQHSLLLYARSNKEAIALYYTYYTLKYFPIHIYFVRFFVTSTSSHLLHISTIFTSTITVYSSFIYYNIYTIFVRHFYTLAFHSRATCFQYICSYTCSFSALNFSRPFDMFVLLSYLLISLYIVINKALYF